jgi:hypothetical protein
MRFLTRSLAVSALFLGAACSSSSPTHFAANQWNPFEVAVRGDQVYWATFDGPAYLRTCAVSGCDGAPKDLASGSWTIERFAVDDDNVYVAVEDPVTYTASIGKCPHSGCSSAPETIVKSTDVSSSYGPAGFVSALTVDANNVYWATEYGVQQCPLQGCVAGAVSLQSITLTDGPVVSPPSIVVDASRVYWSLPNTRTIVACAIGGCGGAPTVLATDQMVVGLALEGTQLSWITGDDGSVKTCDVTDCSATTTTLATNQSPTSVAAQGGNVVWTTQPAAGGGGVMRCSAHGCPGGPARIAGGTAPGWLASGAGKVFWSDWRDQVIDAAPLAE